MSNIKDKVLGMLEDRRNETVELLRELIMTPSPTREERPVSELIAKRSKDFGFDNVEIDDWNNVICHIDGTGGGPTLLYNGHIDVVPLGDLSAWPVDPREAPILEDKVIGRGACDMKGSVAAMMMATNVVKGAGVKLKGNLILTMVGREENSLHDGTRYAIGTHSLKPDIVLIGEATNLEIFLGSRGAILVKVSVRGKSGHAANPSRGINAIVKMTKMIEAIGNMKLPTHDFFSPTTHSITKVTCEPGVLNMIPSLCTIWLTRRIGPGEDTLESAKAEFLGVIEKLRTNDPEFDADVETSNYSPASYLPPQESVVKRVEESAKYVLGRSPKISHYMFGTDGTYFSDEAKIPWFGFGPGDEANAHSANDHVKIDDLVAASKVYAMFIIDLLSK